MNIRNLSELKNWDRNPRSVKEKDFKRLDKQLSLGQHSTLLIWEDNTVLGGNMRIRAMKAKGWETAQVIVLSAQKDELGFYALLDGVVVKEKNENGEMVIPKYWKDIEAMKLEYALSHNDRIGYYDSDLFANLMPEYPEFNWDDYAVDFREPTTVSQLFPEETQEDEVPEVPTEAISKYGEVYQLGRHRLMCGDATKAENVAKLMGGGKADIIFTDPPYNVDYEGKTADALKIENDKFKTNEAFFQFLLDSFKNMAEYSKAGAAIYVCHADSEGLNFRRAFQEAGYLLKQCIIWNKNSMVMGRQDYHWKHEPILYGWRDGGAHSWYGDRSQTTVWDIERPSRSSEHPTMKPIALIAQALKNSSKGEDIVLDLFAGSGSTLIACEQTGRVNYSMELDPRYCDVIRKRYENFKSK